MKNNKAISCPAELLFCFIQKNKTLRLNWWVDICNDMWCLFHSSMMLIEKLPVPSLTNQPASLKTRQNKNSVRKKKKKLVLGKYQNSNHFINIQIVKRICSDCPFVFLWFWYLSKFKARLITEAVHLKLIPQNMYWMLLGDEF